MWLCRAVGYGLILLSCTLAGGAAAGRLSARTRQLRQAVDLIEEIEAEIRYSSRELPAVYEAVAARQDGRRPDDFPAHAGSLTAEDRACYDAFLRGLGGTDLAGQMAHCGRYAALLRTRWESARRAEAEKAKLYRALGLFGGLALVIFLI